MLVLSNWYYRKKQKALTLEPDLRVNQEEAMGAKKREPGTEVLRTNNVTTEQVTTEQVIFYVYFGQRPQRDKCAP